MCCGSDSLFIFSLLKLNTKKLPFSLALDILEHNRETHSQNDCKAKTILIHGTESVGRTVTSWVCVPVCRGAIKAKFLCPKWNKRNVVIINSWRILHKYKPLRRSSHHMYVYVYFFYKRIRLWVCSYIHIYRILVLIHNHFFPSFLLSLIVNSVRF